MAYTIDEHKHRFSAWAASRAASVTNYRFSVLVGRKIIEKIEFMDFAANPDSAQVVVEQFDQMHQQWREQAIEAAHERGKNFSHGIAAKLINVYLKGMIVCGGFYDHPIAACLHPPIDELLLKELYVNDIGGLRNTWSKARKQRWSNFDSQQYEDVISAIRQAMSGSPLWQIEQHWRGFR